MKHLSRILSLLILLAMLLSACQPATPQPTTAPTSAPTAIPQTPEPLTTAAPPPVDDSLYLNLIWHQHQPLYYKDDAGVYTRPWVRVHATKDYYDMASMVAKYPNVHITFNLTPVLIRQLDDYASGAKDLYWVAAEIPADQLSPENKRFILERFFDANWDHIIKVHPRYEELLLKRGGSDSAAIEAALQSFTTQDYLDLQVWFNLAWFDPDFLAADPLKALVEKGSGFSEEDKKIVFDQALQVIQSVVPLHKELQDKGQIEVITTPYAHPILPLITDSSLSQVGNPDGESPALFAYPQDAQEHLARSVEIYQQHYGQQPRGLWPGEGSVAQEIVPMVIEAGYQWMATGEPVLGASLDIDFSRDGKETVRQADELYRPYYVSDGQGGRLAVFFRDWVISDKIGFTYSGMSGKAAAQDLMTRLENIKARLAEQGVPGPHVVTIVVDGENAWENYTNDGKEFFDNLYRMLSESTSIKTITPSEYLKNYPEQRSIDDLFPGAWFSANYDTWIGETEETIAWEYLRQTRETLAKYTDGSSPTEPKDLTAALDYMLLAEGSDWFWWYGADQDSGQDSYFDLGYRALLANVYTALGEPVPDFINAPIIQPKPVSADTPVQGLATPVVDGKVDGEEWAKAALYQAKDGSPVTSLAYLLDAQNVYVKLEMAESSTQVGLYFVVPGAGASSAFAHSADAANPAMLGLAATHLFEITAANPALTGYLPAPAGWQAGSPVGQAAFSDNGIFEFAIPYTALGKVSAGDDIRMLAVAQTAQETTILPAGGPAQVIIPDIDTSVAILEVTDPSGDDHGPGSYTYPSDNVFIPRVYDIETFRVSVDDNNVNFKFTFNGPLTNPWGSTNNLALQTLDVYIDKDPGAGTGARLLLPGRNAALTSGNGWEFAVWAEGWQPQILAPTADTLAPTRLEDDTYKILVDPAASSVTLRVPRSLLGEGDPASWGYAAVVLGQEGYPAPGVWRVRDIAAAAAQWRFGGGTPANTNATRIIDMAWPDESAPTQEEMLSTYPPSTANFETLSADDFAQIGLLLIQ